MATAISSKEMTMQSDYHHQNPRMAPPLLPSERDINGGFSRRQQRFRETPSRYLSSYTTCCSSSSSCSPSSSSSSSSGSSYSARRHPSPLLSRRVSSSSSANPLPMVTKKRSQSVEKKRSLNPRGTEPLSDSRPSNAGEVSVASFKVLFTSTRSFPVSFQGESFSLPISKTKMVAVAVAPPQLRKATTPERRRGGGGTPLRGTKVDGGGGSGGGGGDQVENSISNSNSKKQFDQNLWPSRSRQVNPLPTSFDSTWDVEKPKMGDADSVYSSSSEQSLVRTAPTASDTESVSSGSNSSLGEFGSISRAQTTVPARFWQETNTRTRRCLQDRTPFSKPTGSRTVVRVPIENPISSPRIVSVTPSRALSSPLRGPVRAASPSKLVVPRTSSPSRGMPSPSKVRNSLEGPVSAQLTSNTPSVLSFAVDVRRGKMGENRIANAHQLRLLYNKHLQWRFVNARSDAATFEQRLIAEKQLYNVSVATSKLRTSVTLKRIKVQLLRQKLKLNSVLKGQMADLEEWALLERDHSSSLSGATEALKASTLRLPVVGGAKADVLNVKNAVSSAVDVMQAMASSICSLVSKVEEVNSLMAELANVTMQAKNLLDQCKDHLSILEAMQVKECNLRTQIIQLKK